MDRLECHLLFARAPGLETRHLRALAGAFGTLEAAYSARFRGCNQELSLPGPCLDFLLKPDPALLADDLQWARRSGAQLLSVLDPQYPPALREIPRPPPFLYVLGHVDVLCTPQLAIVGSRNPTAGGRTTARDFAAHLAMSGLTITSGLALGIDAAAHEGALARGTTVAVCGAGLDAIYPRAHAGLADRIAARGAVVSEFPPGTRPLRGHFPRRNRIISGLALGTLVVEAALESGSLITARHALEQGREVFAIPGSIHSPLARGCHELIRQGAKLVESTGDILAELRFSLKDQIVAKTPGSDPVAAHAVPPLDKEYEILLDALGFEPASFDSLVDLTGFPGESLASMLLILELEGRIALQPGGRYCRVP